MFQTIKESYGWLGLFLIISVNGLIALAATLFFPYKPRFISHNFSVSS